VGHSLAIRANPPDHQWVGTVVDPQEETCMKITVLTVVLSLMKTAVHCATDGHDLF
jgi:hypothetical protein